MNSSRLRQDGVSASGDPGADAEKPAEASRRGFIKVAAAAGLAQISTSLLDAAPRRGNAAPGNQGGAGETQAVPGRQHFPAPLSAISPIDGLFDTHAHSAPDVRERSLDDVQTAQLYRDQGMAGVVLKCHVAPTADRAFLASQRVPGIKVFGGVVLNYSVGAINPTAVQWMWRMKGGFGRMVWFPTMDSDHDVKHSKAAEEGIKVVGLDGKVLPAVIEVLKICAKEKLVVNTGHSSAEEGLAIIAAARDVGADRILVTHCQTEIPNMSLEQMKKAASMGAKLELVAAGPMDGPCARGSEKSSRQVPVEETVAAIKAVGAENFVLATDLGQITNPTHADGLSWFVTELMAQGISSDQIKLMGRENPGALLMG